MGAAGSTQSRTGSIEDLLPSGVDWDDVPPETTPRSGQPMSVVFETLPDDASGDDVVFLMRNGDTEPWTNNTAPPENDNPDDRPATISSTSKAALASRVSGRNGPNYQYMTHWDRENVGWSLVLEEENQPPMPITGGYRGAFKASRRAHWSIELSKPLLCRCPGGTSNPGGWVRGKDPLPRSGRHYWEVQYLHHGTKHGKSLEGVFMTGLVSNRRKGYDWNSGIGDFWGIVSGPWRRKTAAAVVIEGGRVRTLDDEEEFDLEDQVLNASGVVHGAGERVGVLVDMDAGWLAFFRNGKPLCQIDRDQFPMLEFDWWPVARPFSPGSTAKLDCHCPVSMEVRHMSAPGSSYDTDDSSEVSSSWSSSSSSSTSDQSSSQSSGSSGNGDTSSSIATFSYVPPSNSSLSVRASEPGIRRSPGPK